MKVKEIQKLLLKRMKTYKLQDFPDAVWLEDPTKFLYVREVIATAMSSNYKGGGKSSLGGGKVIGHTKPIKTPLGNGEYLYRKKLFWLKEYDLGMPKENEGYADEKRFRGFPIEAVRFVK